MPKIGFVQKLTGLTITQQEELFNWFASQPYETKLEAMNLYHLAQNTLREKKGITRKQAVELGCEKEYYFAAWMVVYAKMRSLDTSEFKRFRDTAPSEEELANLDKIRLQRVRAEKRKSKNGKPTLYDMLKFELRNNVINLLNVGASWSEIASILRKHNGIRSDKEFIRKTWKTVEADLATEKSLVEDMKGGEQYG